jgi:hypothetical protein
VQRRRPAPTRVLSMHENVRSNALRHRGRRPGCTGPLRSRRPPEPGHCGKAGNGQRFAGSRAGQPLPCLLRAELHSHLQRSGRRPAEREHMLRVSSRLAWECGSCEAAADPRPSGGWPLRMRRRSELARWGQHQCSGSRCQLQQLCCAAHGLGRSAGSECGGGRAAAAEEKGRVAWPCAEIWPLGADRGSGPSASSSAGRVPAAGAASPRRIPQECGVAELGAAASSPGSHTNPATLRPPGGP